MMFYTTFNNISAILWRSVSIGGGNRRKPPKKSLTNFITLQCMSYRVHLAMNGV
jgi:hypothetical protein